MKLTPNFSLEELTASATAARQGLNNTPPPAIVQNLHELAKKLEEVRYVLGHPVIVSSAYRSLAVNRAIGSKDTSAHIKGLAADFICPGFGSPLEVAEELIAAGVRFDQMIHEFGQWVHLGLRPVDAPWRGELLTISSAGAQTGLHRI
jgi:zinc D-Ala-D-Ala carboxypeptidase